MLTIMHGNKYIAIEGVIGIGKTTLARLLQPHFDATILLEVFEENPFLADFYGDRERYAFQTQIFFLLSRYHQQNKAVPEALSRGMLVSDYTFAKDELFAWLNLRDDELSMYGRVHAALSEKIPKPDLIVYLTADHDVVMRRIALRDRPYERDMDPDYIRQLAAAYEAWLTNLPDVAVLTLNVNELDFLANPEDLDYVVEQIDAALAERVRDRKPRVVEDELLSQGQLAAFQEFHRHLDQNKHFDPDLFFNYILLTEEMGEIASELKGIWRDTKRLVADGRQAEEARGKSLEKHRAALRMELADLLAYTLKLANYAGIDLEQAYLDKMRANIGREWREEEKQPS
jgi:deoxyguanosine kinase